MWKRKDVVNELVVLAIVLQTSAHKSKKIIQTAVLKFEGTFSDEA